MSSCGDLVQETLQLVQPEDKTEVRSETLVKVAKICVTDYTSTGCLKFERLSERHRLINAIALLQRCACAKSFKGKAERSVIFFQKI